jgi:hypothetical protein
MLAIFWPTERKVLRLSNPRLPKWRGFGFLASGLFSLRTAGRAIRKPRRARNLYTFTGVPRRIRLSPSYGECRAPHLFRQPGRRQKPCEIARSHQALCNLGFCRTRPVVVRWCSLTFVFPRCEHSITSRSSRDGWLDPGVNVGKSW